MASPFPVLTYQEAMENTKQTGRILEAGLMNWLFAL